MKQKLKETLAKMLQYLFKCERRTLVWSSDSISTQAAGFVPMDLSGYDFVDILVGFVGSHAAGESTAVCRCKVGYTTILSINGHSSDNTSDAAHFINTCSRTAYVTSTGITYSSGQMTYVGNAYPNWNNRCVPYAVWGIKSGGVLRNPVIARLTAIITSLLFGGDVDEGQYKEAAGKGAGSLAEYRQSVYRKLDSHFKRQNWGAVNSYDDAACRSVCNNDNDTDVKRFGSYFVEHRRPTVLLFRRAAGSNTDNKTDKSAKCICRDFFIRQLDIFLFRSRRIKSSSHSIVISERRWAA